MNPALALPASGVNNEFNAVLRQSFGDNNFMWEAMLAFLYDRYNESMASRDQISPEFILCGGVLESRKGGQFRSKSCDAKQGAKKNGVIKLPPYLHSRITQ